MCIDVFLYQLWRAECSARWMSVSSFAVRLIPAESTPACKRRPQTATTRSGSPMASELAKWTASAPRKARPLLAGQLAVRPLALAPLAESQLELFQACVAPFCKAYCHATFKMTA